MTICISSDCLDNVSAAVTTVPAALSVSAAASETWTMLWLTSAVPWDA